MKIFSIKSYNYEPFCKKIYICLKMKLVLKQKCNNNNSD